MEMSLKWMQRKNTGFGERRNKIPVTRRRRKRKKRRGRWRRMEKKGRRRGRKKGMVEFVWGLVRRIWAGLHDDYSSNLQKREP